ncbi:MAG: hypothetical protein AAGG56_08750 [Pseudomonadota bacterium]
MCITVLATILGSLAHAQTGETPSAPEFEALTKGKSLHFESGGQYYGAEQFFSGRRTLWQFADGNCDPGRWFEADGLICFVYETTPDEQCWRVTGDEVSMEAELYNDGAASGLIVTLTRKDSDPLPCPGPRVGS